jgi:hypothetical protein
MADRDGGVANMAAVAREFCGLIEHLDGLGRDWLERIAGVLPRLHAAIVALPAIPEPPRIATTPDYEHRFELFTKLAHRLGSRDNYWLEFDAAHGEHMSGSLADDLTDIYFDLARGLELMDAAQPEQAAALWRSSFQVHWGQHLVDAERQLYALSVSNRLVAD